MTDSEALVELQSRMAWYERQLAEPLQIREIEQPRLRTRLEQRMHLRHLRDGNHRKQRSARRVDVDSGVLHTVRRDGLQHREMRLEEALRLHRIVPRRVELHAEELRTEAQQRRGSDRPRVRSDSESVNVDLLLL